MFTDIHTHILSGIDDGCSNIEESIFLLKHAADNKIENIILTPHFDPENADAPKKEEIIKKIDFLNLKIRQNNINIKIYPGMEVSITSTLPAKLKDKHYLNSYTVTLMDMKRYILIEAPFLKMPPNFEDMVFKIKLAGLTPILAHPERNSEVRENAAVLEKLRHEGLLIQVNTSSIVDRRGSPSCRSALELLKRDMVDFIASDCHYMQGRHSNFLSAYKLLNKIIGKQKANKIAIENPGFILNNEEFEYKI
jgi:protein-tyrosine phosphatase